MFKKIRLSYPQKNKFLFIAFDASFLLYLIAYFFYYKDATLDGRIRMIATVAIFITGLMIVFVQQKLRLGPCTIWYFVFIVCGITSMLWAVNDTQISSILVTLFRVLFVCFFLSQRVYDDRDLEIVLFLYNVAVLYMIICIGLKMVNYYSLAGLFTHRFGDNFGYNSNTTAVQTSIAFLISFHKVKANRLRFLNILMMVIYVITTVLTGSKKGLLGLLMGLIILMYLKNRGVKKIKVLFISTVIIFITYELIAVVPFLYNQVGYRIVDFLGALNGGSSEGMSTNNRLQLIKQAISIWTKNPMFGVGLNNFSLIQTVGNSGYYAHCNYAELLADLGIIGFIVYYFVPFCFVFSKVNYRNDLHLTLKTLILLIFILDVGMVSYQEIQTLLFYWLFSIVLLEKNNRTIEIPEKAILPES